MVLRQVFTVEFSVILQFSKLVSDSSSSEGVFSLLAQTVVDRCGATHALVFGTTDTGDFALLSSYGSCKDQDIGGLTLEGVGSIAELRAAVSAACSHRGYDFRALPLISEAALWGALVVLFSETASIGERQWSLIEGLTELTAISLNKAYKHQRLQKAFDELRASQDALVRTEKFRALGQMSAGIAHDLKNILNPLLLYTDMIRDADRKRDELLDIAARIDRILTRGLETVERLRDFSRQSSEEADAIPTDLNAMVHEALEITKPQIAGLELVLQLGTPARVLIRPADCVTALVNVLLNAADALKQSGRITVTTGSGDGWAWVEVADNGPGIPPETKSRILEPFFTTKGDSGTGLGLAIVYAFVQRHGGRLDIDSEPHHGARFRMSFPAIA
jgi:signal transduction histidine kinase